MMTRAFGDPKATAFSWLIAGYLILNYPFIQLRIPPTGFGVPLGELLLIIVLASSNIPMLMTRMNAAVLLLPFLIWWTWSLLRLAFDGLEHGFWAFRDATHAVESLFLIAGFALAGRKGALQLLERRLPIIMAAASVYGMSYLFATELARASPTLPGASAQPIPIFGSFATIGTMLLWTGFYCLSRRATRPALRIRYDLVGSFLIAFAILVIQARTTYLQLMALAVLLWLVRPSALKGLILALPILLLLLGTISAFDIRISGRLSSELSLDFFWDHIQSIVGISSSGHAGVAEAAHGVPLRLAWWARLYEQLTADPAILLTGLGFGVPLTDFRDSLGTVTREPHNSIISVAARLGLIGILSWVWVQAELFRVGIGAYRVCRRRNVKEADFVLLVMVFAVLTLAACLGEDGMEKPYYAIPYYAFWGFVLRVAYQLQRRPDEGGVTGPRQSVRMPA